MDTQAPADSVDGTISQAEFLLTELKYTLGQIHVQIGDLDAETRRSAMCEGRTVDGILQEMMKSEDHYLEEYASLLGVDSREFNAAEQDIPLPLNADVDEATDDQNDFEHKRAQTIALLESAGDVWPQPVLDLVKQHVSEDRRHTTELAECRIKYFESDSRPDLDQPLTEHDDLVRKPAPAGESVHPDTNPG